jgi:hypothetical protein
MHFYEQGYGKISMHAYMGRVEQQKQMTEKKQKVESIGTDEL